MSLLQATTNPPTSLGRCGNYGSATTNPTHYPTTYTRPIHVTVPYRKVYQGTSIFAEHALLEEPAGLCAFHGLGDNAGGLPGVAVAAGPYIFIYK